MGEEGGGRGEEGGPRGPTQLSQYFGTSISMKCLVLRCIIDQLFTLSDHKL